MLLQITCVAILFCLVLMLLQIRQLLFIQNQNIIFKIQNEGTKCYYDMRDNFSDETLKFWGMKKKTEEDVKDLLPRLIKFYAEIFPFKHILSETNWKPFELEMQWFISKLHKFENEGTPMRDLFEKRLKLFHPDFEKYMLSLYNSNFLAAEQKFTEAKKGYDKNGN